MLKSFLQKTGGDHVAAKNHILPDKLKQLPVAKYMNIGGTYQADLMEFETDNNLFRYALTFINTTTGQGAAIPLEIKTAPKVYVETEKFIKSHPDMKFLETDGGGEFNNHHFKTLMRQYQIIHKVTLAGKKNQNAKIENHNYQLRKLVNARLETGATTPWKELVKTANQHINTFRETNYKQRKIGEFFKPPILPPKGEMLERGEKVFVKLFKPNKFRFRAGEKRFTVEEKTVENILPRNGQTVKYKVSGIKNALFDRNELNKKKVA